MEKHITEEEDWKHIISTHGELLIEINQRLTRMEETNAPIVNAWNTATTLGKWIMGLVVFGSVVIGSFVGLKDLFHK